MAVSRPSTSGAATRVSLTRRDARLYTRAIVPRSSRPRPLRSPTIPAWFARLPVAAGLIAIAIALIAGPGCSDRQKTAPVGLGQLDSTRTDVNVTTVLDTLPIFDNFAETIVAAGDATTLYAGFFGPRRMRSLLRFSPLPSGRLVVGATVRLRVIGAVGDSVAQTIAVHRILADWTESGTDETTLPAFDATPAVTDTIPAGTSDSLLIDLPTALAQAWVDTSSTNFGLLLAGVEAGILRKIASSEATNDTLRPVLRLETTNLQGGSPETATIVAERDTYVAQPDTSSTAAATRLLIGKENGIARRAGIEFELPAEIDSLTTVNSALLELRLDPTAFRLAGTSVEVSVHEVISSIDTSAVVFRTAAEGTRTVTADTESLSVPITGLVAQQRLTRQRSIRVLVKTQTETLDTDMIAAISAEGASGALFAPRLRFIVSRVDSLAKAATLPAKAAGGESR